MLCKRVLFVREGKCTFAHACTCACTFVHVRACSSLYIFFIELTRCAYDGVFVNVAREHEMTCGV